jgi:hypothetical protein
MMSQRSAPVGWKGLTNPGFEVKSLALVSRLRRGGERDAQRSDLIKEIGSGRQSKNDELRFAING